MPLTFDPISSPDATRDLLIDLSGALESGELLTSATITSAYPAILAVSNVAINTEIVTFAEQETAVGQGVHFTVQTLSASQATVPLTVTFEGDSGTIDKYEIEQPVVVALGS